MGVTESLIVVDKGEGVKNCLKIVDIINGRPLITVCMYSAKIFVRGKTLNPI